MTDERRWQPGERAEQPATAPSGAAGGPAPASAWPRKWGGRYDPPEEEPGFELFAPDTLASSEAGDPGDEGSGGGPAGDGEPAEAR